MNRNAFWKRLVSRWAGLLVAGTLFALLPGGFASANSADSAAASRAAASTAMRTITFSGYTWTVKNSTGPVGPGSNYFSDSPENVWVDGSGALHLKIAQRNGKWYCSEIIANTPLRYGTYTWAITSPLNTLDVNAVLGLFTWDDNTPQYHYKEIDIEIARWNIPNGPNAQYAIQPYDTQGNRYQFTMPLTHSSTHSFDWGPSRVKFDSWEGAQHVTWTYANPAGIPPAGAGNPRINLWLLNATPPADSKDIEVVISSFHLEPVPTPYHFYKPRIVNSLPPELRCPARTSVGVTSPNAFVCYIQYTVNNGPLLIAYYDDTISLKAGDTFRLVSFTYYSDLAGSAGHKLAVEAYIYKNGSIDYGDGRYTPPSVPILIKRGMNSGGAISGPGWVMQNTWDRMNFVLVHYYPGGNEVDDRFFVFFAY